MAEAAPAGAKGHREKGPNGTAAGQRRSLPQWSLEASLQTQELRSALGHVHDENDREEISKLLAEVDDIALRRTPQRIWSRIWDWWHGSSVEQVWGKLHQAELRIVESADDAYLQRVALEKAVDLAGGLDPSDPIRLRLTDLINRMSNNTPGVATEVRKPTGQG